MFRKINGASLSEFTVNCRMEKVIEELVNTDKTITDIAFSAGFTNINSFNRLFRNRYNMTPKEFRVCKPFNSESFNSHEDEMDTNTMKNNA